MRTTPKGWRAWISWAALAVAGGALAFLGNKGMALVWAYLTSL